MIQQAGRGTDIRLDEEAKKAGGLLVIGTEKMNSQRIDNQLRGRAGRQGELGESIFFVSLEDRIVLESAPKWVLKERKKLENGAKKTLEKRKYQSIIFHAQKKRKNQEMDIRKRNLEYDEIISFQREKIYEARNDILKASNKALDQLIRESINRVVYAFVEKKTNFEKTILVDFIYQNIDYDYSLSEQKIDFSLNEKNIIIFLETLITNQEKK